MCLPSGEHCRSLLVDVCRLIQPLLCSVSEFLLILVPFPPIHKWFIFRRFISTLYGTVYSVSGKYSTGFLSG